MNAEDTLAALRSGDEADLRDTGTRAEVTGLLAGSLQPGDHALARRLLAAEIAALTGAGAGATETLYTLVAIVARYADPGDALLIWRARMATPETRAGLDVEQMARAGLAGVRGRLTELAQSGGPRAHDAAAALQWVVAGAATGAFDDLPGYFAWSDERYGLHVSGAT
ncbi:MAG: hypothetical protein ACRDHE_08875 [Ktedonobacterales bacterium]